MDPGVFVLGMARSGTSAVTHVVNLLGVEGAREDDLKPADDDNPMGYWESRALTDLNRRLLVAVGGPPYGPAPAFPPDWLQSSDLDDLREEARALMRRIHPRTPWVWKDPRTCLTLPFWIEVAEVDPVVLLVCSGSTRGRGLARAARRCSDSRNCRGLGAINRAALANSRGLPTFVIRYDRLVEEPLAVAAELAAFLRRLGLQIEEPGRELERFVDPALRRSRPDTRTRNLPSPEQLALLGILEELQGAHNAFPLLELPAETPWVDGLLEAERVTGMLDWLRERRQAARVLDGQIARRSAFGLEVRVARGGPAWRALSPFRRLAALVSSRGA